MRTFAVLCCILARLVGAQLFYRQPQANYFARRQPPALVQPLQQYRSFPINPWSSGGIYGGLPSMRPNPVVAPSNSISGAPCPKGPYAQFLSQQEQEGLHELIIEARSSGASESEVKQYITKYIQTVLSPEKYRQFEASYRAFEETRSQLYP